MAHASSQSSHLAARRRFLKMMAFGTATLLTTPLPLFGRWRDRGVDLVRVRRQSLLMGSVASFDVVAATERDGYAAIEGAVRIFRKVDARLSMYRADSEVAAVARHAGKTPVTITVDTETVLRYAREMSNQTGGRFDITIEPIMRRWGFRQDPDRTIVQPSEKALRELEHRIGYEHLHLENGQAYLNRPGMALDVGGLAGGYALDRAIEAMKQFSVAAAFINFSGDVHSFGVPVDGVPWSVRLLDLITRQPLSDEIVLGGRALSTSGAYENRRHDDAGRSWGHLIAPDSGRPVAPFDSVTVLHSSAMIADAWSTAAFVGARPVEPGLDFITM